MQTLPPADLLALVFSGIEEDQPWKSLVRQLRLHLRSGYAGMVLRHSTRPQWDGFSSSDADWDLAHWRQELLPGFFAERHMLVGRDLPAGDVYELDQILDRSEWLNSPMYRELLHPVGMDHLLCLCFETANGQRGQIYVGRKEAVGRFGPEDLALCRALIPWLQQALQIYLRLTWKAAELDAAENALMAMGIGSLLLDPQCHVLSADPAARSILARCDELSIAEDRLLLRDAEAAAEFATLQAQLQAEADGGAKALRLRRAGSTALTLLLRRAPPRDYGLPVRPSLLVHLSDPELAARLPAGQVLAELFGLTPREASVAELLTQGLSLSEVAARLGLTLGTVRIYLKRIFSKTGVNRQAELVRIVSSSLAMFGQQA